MNEIIALITDHNYDRNGNYRCKIRLFKEGELSNDLQYKRAGKDLSKEIYPAGRWVPNDNSIILQDTKDNALCAIQEAKEKGIIKDYRFILD